MNAFDQDKYENLNEPILPGMTAREAQLRRQVHHLAEFYRHLTVYIIVIGAMWIVNAYFVLGSDKPVKWSMWPVIWPTVGWGIGVFFHGLSALPNRGFFSQDWEERKVRELIEREGK